MNSPTINQIKTEILEIVGSESQTVRLKLEKYLADILAEGRIVGGDISLQTIDIEVENYQRVGNISHLIYLINSTGEKSEFANSILFTSAKTDPDKALFEALKTNVIQMATIVVQRTAYAGFYYIHKSRYTAEHNKLVSESDLEEILLTTLSEMNKPL